MSAEYPHLPKAMHALAAESDQARIARIRADRWINYNRADSALAALEDLMTFPKRTRMPNLLLVGPTNNGKTMIVERFRRTHPPTSAKETSKGFAVVPVLRVQMPAGPDELRFFAAILEAMNFPFLRSDRIDKRQGRAMTLLRDTQVQLLVIDEIHNLLSGTRLQQRRLLNLLRWLGNELQIPLVGVGTSEAQHAIQSDDQLANRFNPVTLPHWRAGTEFRQLLNAMESVLPLRQPSELRGDSLSELILSSSEGILGEIVALIMGAAVQAIRSGAERITAKAIEQTGYLPPSKRRRVG